MAKYLDDSYSPVPFAKDERREGVKFTRPFFRPRATGAAAVAAPWAPTDLANLLAWWKMATGITIATGVSVWADQTANGYDLTKIFTTQQPAYSDGVVTFDGTDDWLNNTSLALTQPYTIYLLARHITWASNDRHFDGVGALSVLRDTGVTPEIQLFAAGASSGNTDWPIDTNFYAIACIFDGANSLIQVGSGGTPTAGATVGVTAPTGFALGASGSGGNAANVAVKEAMIYSAAHDADTRATVMGYLEGL